MAGFSVGEEFLVRKTTKTLHHTSYHIEKLIKENKENINCKVVRDEFDDLDNYWDKTEQLLCYIVNFEKREVIFERGEFAGKILVALGGCPYISKHSLHAGDVVV